MKLTVKLQMHNTEILFQENNNTSEKAIVKSLKRLGYEGEIKNGMAWKVGTHNYIAYITK